MPALPAASWTVRIGGLVAIVLGLFIWIMPSGSADGIRPLHILVGILIVLGLWTLAALSLRAGGAPALPVIAIAWGVLLPIFGLTQANLLVGSGHVIVQVGHLLVGLISIGLGEALAARALRSGVAPS